MKNYISAVALCLVSGISMAQDEFKITGSLPQVGNDKMVLLTYTTPEGKSAKDSAAVVDGKFELKGITAFGNRAYLELKPKVKDPNIKRPGVDYKDFYLEKGSFTVKGKDSMATALISGGQAQKDHLDYSAAMDPNQSKYKALAAVYMKARSAKDSVEMKRLSEELKPVMAKMEEVLETFIVSHPDSYVTADLILANKMMVVDPAVFDRYYTALTPRVLKSFTGKKITDKYNKAKQMAIGKHIDFTLPDANGKTFTLSSLKGKYVLVDFWASWCVPCRAENPHLLKAYKELKDRNFEIVGVSLDESREPWLKAVAFDKLPWTQVSDVKGFKTEVAVRFGITAIPQNFLIDPQGLVIAKDLRGEDVNKKIAAYLK